MTTVLDDDNAGLNAHLFNMSMKQQEQLRDELLAEEAQFNKRNKESKDDQILREKFAEFLTFKEYGKGAFGSVTEYYDIVTRTKYAKKVFAEIKDYKIELDVMKNLQQYYTQEEMSKIIAGIEKTDINSLALYYESGVCNLIEIVNRRRLRHIYWWDHEDQLCYIITRIYELIMALFNKNIYHSDLKPVNLVLLQDEQDPKKMLLKMIDMGGATFDYNYLVAITPSYFPDRNKNDVTCNKNMRLMAEFYQLGRIMQEICLSSIYAKQQDIYAELGFLRFKDFMREYFENDESSIKKCLELLKPYYSRRVVEIIQLFLSCTDCVQQIQQKMGKISSQSGGCVYDQHKFAVISQDQKINAYLNQMQSQTSGKELIKEFEFYYQFDLDDRADRKINTLIDQTNNLKASFSRNPEKYPLLMIYQCIFKKRLGILTTSNPLWNAIVNLGNVEEITKFNEDSINYIRRIFFESGDGSIDEKLRLRFLQEIMFKGDYDGNPYLTEKIMQDFLNIFGINPQTKDPYLSALNKFSRFFIQGLKIKDSVSNVKKQLKIFQKLIEKETDREKKQIYELNIVELKLAMLSNWWNEKSKINDCVELSKECEKLIISCKQGRLNKLMQLSQLSYGYFLFKQQKKNGTKQEGILKEAENALLEAFVLRSKIGEPMESIRIKIFKALSEYYFYIGKKERCYQYDFLTGELAGEKKDYQKSKGEPRFKEYMNVLDTHQQVGAESAHRESLQIYKKSMIYSRQYIDRMTAQDLDAHVISYDWETKVIGEFQEFFRDMEKDAANGFRYLKRGFDKIREFESSELRESLMDQQGQMYPVTSAKEVLGCRFKLQLLRLAYMRNIDMNFLLTQLNYLKERYLDYPHKSNEVGIYQLFIIIQARQSLDVEEILEDFRELTTIQKESLRLLQKLQERYIK